LDHQGHIFFGYPSKPDLLCETLGRSARLIEESTGLQTLPWEKLRIEGRIVVDRVLNAIDGARLAVFEVTDLNLNVLFELGYAIARGKKIWLLRDPSIADSDRAWEHMKLLVPIGYTSYSASEDVRTAFSQVRPDLAEASLYDSFIDQSLSLEPPVTLLHARSPHSDDADREVVKRVSRATAEGIRRVTIDPDESPVEPLAWYAQHVAGASAVLLHFASPRRRDAILFNSRYAFVAGLATGFETNMLMVAEDNIVAPFDYQHRIYRYVSARGLGNYVDGWLNKNLVPAFDELARRRETLKRRARVDELRTLDLGEHLAENEESALPGYFVETASYREVLRHATTVFEGRKGTGKTANLLRAAAELRDDKRNLVCVIQPVSYELDGVIALLADLRATARGSYVLESLWKYIVYSEIAIAAADEVRRKPEYTRIDGSAESEFLSYIEGAGRLFLDDFAIRLESALERLTGAYGSGSFADQRLAIAEALHDGPLTELRRLLGQLLSGHKRVAVLVDNLDKSWQGTDNLDDLARFLLGLLESAPAIARDFGKGAGWRSPVPVTLSIFIRSDILTRVRTVAREADKMPVATLEWNRHLLRAVVEERYQAGQERDVPDNEIWTRFFCSTVGSIDTPDFIAERVLPRPRDMLYYCKAAISAAVNARHGRVEIDDLATADQTYSSFAFEALMVEAESIVPTGMDFETLFFELAGMDARSSVEAIEEAVGRAGVATERTAEAIRLLRDVGVLGLEVQREAFDFSETVEGRRRADALNARYIATQKLPRRFAIRSAYCPYLGIEDHLTGALRSASSGPPDGGTLF
jgi:hypothetical protein